MTPVIATTSRATHPRSLARPFAVAVLAALLAVLAAGCGGSDSAPSADTSSAAAIEKALYEKGDTQEVSCESLGTVDVGGVSREVARCSFTEEKDGAGEMRAKAGCFALENGAPLDVTMDVPSDVSCVKS